jgi:hypothetical protein
MLSRMILVGLVAVLGVSLPSRSDSGSWLTPAHDWVIAQLADWDTYTPGKDCGFIATEAPDPLPREATRAPERTNTTTSVAFDPIPVTNGLADELNRLAGGLDILATVTAIAESPVDSVVVSSSDSVEWKLAVELRRIAETSASDEPCSSQATPRAREAEMDPAIDEIFADASQVFAPATEAMATAAQPKSVSIAARPSCELAQTLVSQPCEADADPTIDEIFADGSQVFAPSEQAMATAGQSESASIAAQPIFELIPPPVDFETDIATELNLCGEGVETTFEDDAPTRSEPIRTFDSIEVPADLDSGIAYELNRASEGLEIALPEIRKPSEAPSPIPASATTANVQDEPNSGNASIGKALGLTRDAALAWMNVLSGTTPVMMTSQ